MLTWDKIDERFFQTGTDRGVLYPSTPAVSEVVATNRALNPKGADAGFDEWLTRYAWTRTVVTGVVTPIPDVTSVEMFTSPATDQVSVQGRGWDIYGNMETACGNYGSWIKQPVTPGETFTISTYIRSSVASQFRVQARFHDGAAYSDVRQTSALFDVPANTWTRIYFTVTAPAGAAYLVASVNNGVSSTFPAGSTIESTGLMIDPSSQLHDYFDGDTTDNWLYEYGWTGVANQSASTKTKIAIDPVVWNGITGVEESGNGSTSISYIDGKIFLADSDATDFSGKLTAFFFPDEFAVCLGMPQVADGLILDNQKPKRFGLSYRSLIGSGSAGDMFGYQIHLIYNVMAEVNPISRKTVNNTPAPDEFSFNLVATPVKLPGYRPTAHYIIDTRRLDPETIVELESILYGSKDGLTPGRLPQPIELFDMLSFGASLAVTSYLADGTYNVKGARSNVYMTGTDTYQIDNINAVDNGDGTYTISDGGDTTVTEV